MFYAIDQNNSGGYFIMNEDVTQWLVVEANSLEEAQERLETITEPYSEYCECCGERWDTEYISKRNTGEIPTIHEQPVSESKADLFKDECIIYYLDGRKELVKLKGRN